MAIFHLHTQSIGRGEGRSSVAAAAYRSASKLVEYLVSKEGIQFEVEHDYRYKKGVVFSSIMTPEFAPEFAQDRELLWNKIQNEFELRRNSRFSRDVTLALPVELTEEKNIQLLKEFVHDTFVKEGMIADVNFHNDNPENPHAHIMLTTREIVPDAYEDGDYTFGQKVRYWNSAGFLVQIRRMWAGYINKYLELEGIEQEVSHLSHEERGIDLKPTIKEGVGRYLGEASERHVLNNEIQASNLERIKADPELVLDKFRRNKTVFTKEDIANELFTLFAGGAEIDELAGQKSFSGYVQALDKVMSSEKLLLLHERALSGKQLYTSKDRYELEKDFTEMLVSIKDRQTSHSLGTTSEDFDKKSLFEKTKEFIGFEKENIVLSEKQRAVALEVLNSEHSISVVEGLPGAGKTSLMREVVRQYRKAGYNVQGIAVSSSAARELGTSANIRSMNITKFRYDTDRGLGRKFKLNLSMDFYKEDESLAASLLTKKDVLIFDESSMGDLTEYHYVVREVERSGAKLILLGDSNQLASVGIQGAAEKIAEIFGKSRLDEVRRQNNLRHREATKLIADYKIPAAIGIFRETNCFSFTSNQERAKDALVWDYVKEYKERIEKPSSKELILSDKMVALAYTNADVAYLNNAIRTKLVDSGSIKGKEVSFMINRAGIREEIRLAKGDQVVFTANRVFRQDVVTGARAGIGRIGSGILSEIEVVNSETGVVVGIGRSRDGERDTVLVSLAKNENSIFGLSNRVVELDNKYFKAIDYGYAKNVYKSQGKTYESVLALVDEHTGFNTFNVMATRHTDNLKIYASDETLNSELYRKISLDSEQARKDFDIKSDYKDVDSRRYAGLVAIAQKRGDTSFSRDYEKSALTAEREVVSEYIDVRNEAIKMREAVDNWLDLEKLKGRVHSYNYSPYSEELKELLEQRKELALTIADNYMDYHKMLTQAKINYNTIERHADMSEFKYYFNRKDYSGSIRDMEELREVLDLQRVLSKCEVGALFEKEVAKSALALKEVSSRLVEEIEEHKLAITTTRIHLQDVQDEKYKAEVFVRDGREYIDKHMNQYLEKTFKDKPDFIIEKWNELKLEKGLNGALDLIKESPQSLARLKGLGIGGFSLSGARAAAKENSEVLADKFEKYEEYRSEVPKYEILLAKDTKSREITKSALVVNTYDKRILELELELKGLESKLPNNAVQEFIKSAYKASQSCQLIQSKEVDEASRVSHQDTLEIQAIQESVSNHEVVLTWAKDVKVVSKADQYREVLESSSNKIVNNLDCVNDMAVDVGSKDYIKTRDVTLQQYEHSKGVDDRSKIYRNIAESLEADLAYEILKDVSFKEIVGDKAQFILTCDHYLKDKHKQEKMKEAILGCVQNSISSDIREVELLKQDQNVNSRDAKHIDENAAQDKIHQDKLQTLPIKEFEFIKRVLADQLLDRKPIENQTFTAGDYLRLEIEAERISGIIINERIKSGVTIQSEVSRKELEQAQDIYSGRDGRIKELLASHEMAKDLFRENPLAGRIFAENLVDRQMAKDATIKVNSKHELELQETIAIEQAKVIKDLEPINSYASSNNKSIDTNTNQNHDLNNNRNISKNKNKKENVLSNEVIREDHKDRIEYIKHSSSKAIEHELSHSHGKIFDIAKVQSITSLEIHNTDKKLLNLQKQFKVERQQELQQDLQRQMSRDRGLDR